MQTDDIMPYLDDRIYFLQMMVVVTPTSAIMGAGLGNDVALLTDGRFSGGSHVSMQYPYYKKLFPFL